MPATLKSALPLTVKVDSIERPEAQVLDMVATIGPIVLPSSAKYYRYYSLLLDSIRWSAWQILTIAAMAEIVNDLSVF